MTQRRSARPLSLCVFAGTRNGVGPLAAEAADELGTLVGRRGHALVYGGGGSGLMGAVSWAAHRAGANVIGVMPHFLYEAERAIAAPPQELSLTTTMALRKIEMLERSDAFIALPGGLGTLDEVFEVLSLGYLSLHTKPMVLLDVEGSWQGLQAVLDDVCRRGFATPGQCGLSVAFSAAEALRVVETAAAPALTGGTSC